MNSCPFFSIKIFLLILFFSFLQISCKPKNPSNDRIYDRDLSDQTHYNHKQDSEHHFSDGDDAMQDLDDFDDDDDDDDSHDTSYDHEAFLGKDDAKVFDTLTPEESKARLIDIIENKVDLDKDGLVSEEELKNWIDFTSKRYLIENRDKNWKNFGFSETESDSQNLLSWPTYKLKTFGADQDEKEPANENIKTMMIILHRDEVRWNNADSDKDSFLNKEEFLAFLYPEEFSHMREVVINETIADLDKNLDGFIDIDEYINDLWTAKDSEEEPSWVANERSQFSTHRDKNKDGRLDREEIFDWILPKDYDHVVAETKHLISQADKNHDKRLTKDEILNNYDLFVGSQATDFGEALKRKEDL